MIVQSLWVLWGEFYALVYGYLHGYLPSSLLYKIKDGWSHKRHVWIVIEVWRSVKNEGQSVEKLCTDETFKSVILIDGYCRYDK